MTLEEFQQFIDEQDEFFRSLNKLNYTDNERILARTVKITEELGELCDEVLASIGDQRIGKLEGRDVKNLQGEFADVVITVFMLAKAMNVDIPSALEWKIKVVKEKHRKQLKER